uniref:Uncharacterized protein n=1 Tax=Romanomermis culicivorax TaxID=13658 RepID=A0A915I2G8_ROMCU
DIPVLQKADALVPIPGGKCLDTNQLHRRCHLFPMDFEMLSDGQEKTTGIGPSPGGIHTTFCLGPGVCCGCLHDTKTMWAHFVVDPVGGPTDQFLGCQSCLWRAYGGLSDGLFVPVCTWGIGNILHCRYTL